LIYQLKQRVWSWTNSYDIKDDQGRPVLYVKGKYFSWGHNLSVCDAQGNEVAQIHQRLLSLMPVYELYRQGKLFAEIVKTFTWFNSKFVLDVPGPNDYEIDGSFWQYEYEFRRSGRVVATVSKQFWSWGDTYGVNIVPGEDDLSILATMIVIDLCCHEDKNNS
jgi:uncharacterized protein YxjI